MRAGAILIFVYLALLNLFTVLYTVADKRHARKKAWRVPERSLLLLGFFGGALGEFLTMLLIRHKTAKPKFMVLLPLFILMHAALLYGAYRLFQGKVW